MAIFSHFAYVCSNSSIPPPSSPSSSVGTNFCAMMAGSAGFAGPYLSPSAVTWGYPHMEIVTFTILKGTGDPQSLSRTLWLSRYPNASSVSDWSTNRRDKAYGPFSYITGNIWPITHAVTPVMRPGNFTDIYALGGGADHALWSQSHSNSMYLGFDNASSNAFTWVTTDTV